MNKKILIGSIIAVAVLIGISFTSVVGYQSTSRTIAETSPLFTVRSSRALDVDSKDLTCDYVGMGEESILSIPKRDNMTILMKRVIDKLKKMDENQLKQFIGFIKKQISVNNYLNNEDLDDDILNQLRTNSMIKQYLNDVKVNVNNLNINVLTEKIGHTNIGVTSEIDACLTTIIVFAFIICLFLLTLPISIPLSILLLLFVLFLGWWISYMGYCYL